MPGDDFKAIIAGAPEDDGDPVSDGPLGPEPSPYNGAGAGPHDDPLRDPLTFTDPITLQGEPAPVARRPGERRRLFRIDCMGGDGEVDLAPHETAGGGWRARRPSRARAQTGGL